MPVAPRRALAELALEVRHLEALLVHDRSVAEVPGLADWLAEPAVQQAVAALRQGLPCQLMLVGGDAAMRATRVRALLGAGLVDRGVILDRLGTVRESHRASADRAVAWLSAPPG